MTMTDEPIRVAPNYRNMVEKDPGEARAVEQSRVERMVYFDQHVDTGETVTPWWVRDAERQRKSTWVARGVAIPEAISLSGDGMDRALSLAGLDWSIVERPVSIELPDGSPLVVPGYKALCRSDTDAPLSVQKVSYEALHNREAFEWGNELLRGGAKLATMGSLDEGRNVWACMIVPHDLTVLARATSEFAGRQVYTPFCVISTGHTGASSARADFTAEWTQCGNTLKFGIETAHASLTYRHTRNMRDRMDQAKYVLGLADDYFTAFDAEVADLLARRLDDREFERLTEALFPVAEDATERQRNKAERAKAGVQRIYTTDATAATFKGTGWGAVQAANIWDLWERPVRGGENGQLDRQIKGVFDGRSTKLTDRMRMLVHG